LTPEIALFEHFEQFLADFDLFSTIKWKLSYKTIVEIVNNTSEIMLKQIFPKNFSPFWPFDVILTPKTVLFDHFEQFFTDLSLFLEYNMACTP